MADRLPVEMKDFLRKMFDEIDTDGSGSMDAWELKAIVEKCEGCNASEAIQKEMAVIVEKWGCDASEAIQKEMASMDINGDGKITFDEMCTVIAAALGK